MKDPYLKPGQVCKVWNNNEMNKPVLYLKFFGFDGEIPLFIESCFTESYFENYRPIGTEWDPGRYPEWAVCSTVIESGHMYYWDHVPVTGCGVWVFSSNNYDEMMCCGLCPDKSRYENGAWKTSLRMRPEWAKDEL